MKLTTLAAAIAIGLLAAGCGGGGGGGSGGSTGTTPANPSTSAPVVAGVASFSGTRGDYGVTPTATGYTVTERRTGSATTVTSAHTLRFLDVTVNLLISEKATVLGQRRTRELIELYMALLGRVPEANSLAVLIDKKNAGQSDVQLADGLYAEAVQNPSVTGYSAGMTNSEFVTAAYKTAFGRTGATAPTAATVESWSVLIDKGGVSRGALMLQMLAAAHSGTSDLNTPAVTLLLENRTSVGHYFAVQHGLTYNSAEMALTKTMAIADAVTASDITTAQALLGFSDAAFVTAGGTK